MLDKQEIAELIAFRKLLHKHPELSEMEKETADKVHEFLKKCKPSSIMNSVGGHGVIAIYDSKKVGPSILFRADMDALPIQETNDFMHHSNHDGVSHKCGHDGHTTILLGLATLLSKHPPQKGKAILLFQPAEEIGKGAAAVLKDKNFNEIKPDWVFGLHNLPGFPMHEVVVKKDSFTASVTSIVIDFQGKTTHAAEPEHGINPAMAISELILQASLWSNNLQKREDFAVITPIHIDMGSKAFGTSAGQATIGFTIRTWTEREMERLKAKLENFLITVAKKHRLKLSFKYLEEFKACENHPEATEKIKKVAKSQNLKVTETLMPFKWGEDFGLFTQKFKGAFFGLGAGEDSPALHNPDYDFPDVLIPSGATLFYELCKIHGQCK